MGDFGERMVHAKEPSGQCGGVMVNSLLAKCAGRQIRLLPPQLSKTPRLYKTVPCTQNCALHPWFQTGIGAWSPGWLFQLGRQESALLCCIPHPAPPSQKKITTFSGCHLFILLASELAEMSFDG